MDAVVVETEKVARDCIGYMRDHLLCVATFLPLDTIRVKSVPDRLRTLHKGARPAIDTLTYAPATAAHRPCGRGAESAVRAGPAG